LTIHKESSDRLEAGEPESGEKVLRGLTTKGGGNTFALAIATCGVGFIPLAPGTWGSAVGVIIAAVIARIVSRYHYLLVPDTFTSEIAVRNLCLLAAVFIISGAGIWAATKVEKSTGIKDPGIVVIDEVAGQLVTFLLIGRALSPSVLVLGFLLFRLFDVWKPYPVRNLERLESGLGIVADDLLAGIYSAVVLSVIFSLRLVQF
jgi:phosphatidylglycerophosphatase A